MQSVDSVFLSTETTDQSAPIYQIATVAEVAEDGVSLLFDGADAPTEKHYRVNVSSKLSAGDRVVIQSISGSYVVICAIGSPSGDTDAPNYIPTGGSDGQVLAKDGDSDYTLKWITPPENYIPTGGTDGQVLCKSGNSAYALKWADAPTNHIPSGGTDGQILAKSGSTAYSLRWIDAPKNYIPSGGSDGQVLTKSGTVNYSVKWADAPAAAKLSSGSNSLTLNTKVLTPSATGFEVGTATYPIAFHGKSIRLYYSAYKYCTLACNASGKLTVDGTAIN